MAEQTKFWYLDHFNLFEGLDEGTMMELDRMASMSEVKQHQPIYFPDKPSHSIFLLIKRACNSLLLERGREGSNS